MFGDLPPSSSDTCFRSRAAACTISLPTSVEPVKATLSTPGWAASAAPAVSPKPVTMFTTPGGSPASCRISPRRSARERSLFGHLQHHGAARGQRRRELPGRHQQREVPGNDLAHDADRLRPRIGVVLHARRVEHRERDGLALDLGAPARHVLEDVCRQRHIRRRAPTAIGLPLSSDSSSASSSVYLEIRSPIRHTSLPRSEAVIAGQGPDSKARRAARTARSMSALSPSATRAMVAPVAGFFTSKVFSEAAATHLPSISSLFGVARNWATVREVCGSLSAAFIVESP